MRECLSTGISGNTRRLVVTGAALALFALPLAAPFALAAAYVSAANSARAADACRIAYWRAGEVGGESAGLVAERACLRAAL